MLPSFRPGNLGHHIRPAIGLRGRVDDLGTCPAVVIVGESRALPGAPLNLYHVPCLDKGQRPCRRQANAHLQIAYFFGNSKLHNIIPQCLCFVFFFLYVTTALARSICYASVTRHLSPGFANR